MSNPLQDNSLAERVQRHLDDFLDQQSPLLGNISSDTTALLGALRDMLRGGKRLRPAFAYWGFRAADGIDSEELIRACSSLEMLQACALIHDDVMDASDTRRGQPAMHRRFESLHKTQGWQGDAAAYGAGTAILVGDLALSWADQMLLTCGMDSLAVARAKNVYDVMRTELMAGQYLDLLEQNRRCTTVEQARNVIRYKSAKYTIEQPLLMGIALAGGSSSVEIALSTYGLSLGEAFQIRDDLLGVFGDPSVTGKPAGDDLREGKQTVLIALARDVIGDQVDRLLNACASDASAVAQLTALLQESGAEQAAENMVTNSLDAAIAALDTPAIAKDARNALEKLAVIATARKA